MSIKNINPKYFIAVSTTHYGIMRLDLSKMIKEYQTEETTDKIRSLKHSKQIRENVTTMMNLKHKYQRMEQTDNSRFKQLVTRHCSFLYDNYTNLFNKLFKNELENLLNFVEIS